MYDLIIVGAGPGGLAAALDAHYLKLRTLVIEADKAGGALSQSYPWKGVDSFLGFHKKKGGEISDVIVRHVMDSGAEIKENECVLEITKGSHFSVKTSKGIYDSRTVIIATGIRGTPRNLGVPGEDLAGVSYSVSDPSQFKGRNVLVVGGGDSAADCALGLEEAGANVWMAHRKDELRATDENRESISKSSVRMLWSNEVVNFTGKTKLSGAVLSGKEGKKNLPIDNAVICIGSLPSTACLEKLGITAEGSSVKVDENCMTGVEGLFAAGDMVSSLKRIPQALATGEKAVYAAYKMIKNPYWK